MWQDSYGKRTRFDVPEFDLVARQAFSFGGNYDRNAETFWRGTHPRGPRWAFLDWDFPGLRWLAKGRPLPPAPGDAWRLFFGRFESLRAGGQRTVSW